MDGGFIVQIALRFVVVFDDLDGFGPVCLEVGNSFTEPFEKLVHDVRMFLDKGKTG